jgi:hypothetical protein
MAACCIHLNPVAPLIEYGQPKYLQTNRLTYQWDMVIIFLSFVFFAKVWHFTGLLISFIFLGCGAVLYVHFVRRKKVKGVSNTISIRPLCL